MEAEVHVCCVGACQQNKWGIVATEDDDVPCVEHGRGEKSCECESKNESSNGVGIEGGNSFCQSQEETLTTRQALILETFRNERGTAAAARKLNVRPDSIKAALTAIRIKLGVDSRSGLLREGDTLRSADKKAGSNEVTAAALLSLIEQQEYRCAISGETLTPDVASLDHMKPISRGGTHTMDNVAWVHKRINSAKGTMDTEEFVDMCRKVVGYTDSGGPPC